MRACAECMTKSFERAIDRVIANLEPTLPNKALLWTLDSFRRLFAAEIHR